MSYNSIHDGARLKWQDPEKLLAEIGLKPGDTFVDVGCGDGFFAIPAAKIVGEKGRVYGLDISRSAITRLEERAKTLGLVNLIINLGRAEDSVLCDGCADFVFFGIVLHDFDDREKVVKNAKKMLKPLGKLVDLDFKKEPMPFGPPVSIKLTEKEASTLIERAGFKIESVKTVEPYSYLIIAGTSIPSSAR